MPAIQSRLDAAGDAFQKNRARMMALVGQLRALEARATEASARARPLFDKRGQLLPRERLLKQLLAPRAHLFIRVHERIGQGAHARARPLGRPLLQPLDAHLRIGTRQRCRQARPADHLLA